MKKKAFVVGWYISKNFGTCLQAYSLFSTITHMGFECYMLNHISLFSLGDITEMYKCGKLKVDSKLRENNVKNQYRSIFSTYSSEFAFKKKYINSFVSDNYHFPDINKFFNNSYINNKNNIFITGSDQIWNPYYLLKPYLLSFVNNQPRKIAYSSSFGINNLPDNCKPLYKKYLSRFDSISVRENSGARIIRDLLNKEVQVVLDPVFLTKKNEWFKLAQKAQISGISRPYLLCYFVGDNDSYWIEIDSIQQKTGLDVIILTYNYSDFYRKGHLYTAAGPNEFVWLIKNANLICTDSFHATALSIVLHKNFYLFKRFNDDDPRSQNSRIYEIASKFNIQSRFWDKDKINNLEESINFSETEEILNSERTRSMEYLFNSLF